MSISPESCGQGCRDPEICSGAQADGLIGGLPGDDWRLAEPVDQRSAKSPPPASRFLISCAGWLPKGYTRGRSVDLSRKMKIIGSGESATVYRSSRGEEALTSTVDFSRPFEEVLSLLTRLLQRGDLVC